MANNTIWRFPAVSKFTGLGHSSIYQKIADDEFPKPIKLGARAVGWISDEIEQWVQDRIDESRSDYSND